MTIKKDLDSLSPYDVEEVEFTEYHQALIDLQESNKIFSLRCYLDGLELENKNRKKYYLMLARFYEFYFIPIGKFGKSVIRFIKNLKRFGKVAFWKTCWYKFIKWFWVELDSIRTWYRKRRYIEEIDGRTILRTKGWVVYKTSSPVKIYFMR